MPRNLSDHFTLEELILSQTASRKGIDNTPSPEIVKSLRKLAETLEQVRALLGDAPILVSSGYRSTKLNKAVGGSTTSAHMDGLAADFTAPSFGTVMQVVRKIAASDSVYDQVIHEFGAWVHLGLAKGDAQPGLQKLSVFEGTGYLNGIVGRPS